MKRPFLIIFLVLFFDQLLKIWVKTHMIPQESITMAGNWFFLTFVENNGMAFGMEFGGEFGKLTLSLFRVIVVGVMAYYLFKAAKNGTLHKGLVVSFSLIVAGAFGNIIDSMFYGLMFSDNYGEVAKFLPEGGGYASFLHGKVVDMFYFPITTFHIPSWSPIYSGESFLFFSPVFNLADFAISTGVGVFLLYQKHFFKEEKKDQPNTETIVPEEV